METRGLRHLPRLPVSSILCAPLCSAYPLGSAGVHSGWQQTKFEKQCSPLVVAIKLSFLLCNTCNISLQGFCLFLSPPPNPIALQELREEEIVISGLTRDQVVYVFHGNCSTNKLLFVLSIVRGN